MKKLEQQDFDRFNCPIFRSVSEIGDQWMLLIIREAFMGIKRFDEFQSILHISKSVLTRKMKSLVENGILAKESYQEPNQRKRFEYILTPKGRDLYLIIMALMDWGNKYAVDQEGDRMKMIEKETETDVAFGMVNQQGQKVEPSEVKLLLYRED